MPGHRGLVEVEAESAALLVLSAHHVDTSPYTVPYVSTWASRVEGVDPVTAVQQTAARVRTIALSILDRLDTAMVPDGDPPGLDRLLAEQDAPLDSSSCCSGAPRHRRTASGYEWPP
ncbi:hypothetical protein [Antribacter soli]|uniref:hypothetical protein n=1 Tax=Antribacter soli TaxID=2910976 RepID=UPI001F48DA61|nr:hypothetical protein [Antribacter soli]